MTDKDRLKQAEAIVKAICTLAIGLPDDQRVTIDWGRGDGAHVTLGRLREWAGWGER